MGWLRNQQKRFVKELERQERLEKARKTEERQPANREELDLRIVTHDENGIAAVRNFIHDWPPPAGLLPSRGDAHPSFPNLVSVTGPTYPSYPVGLRAGRQLWRTTIIYRAAADIVRAGRPRRLDVSRRRWAAYQK